MIFYGSKASKIGQFNIKDIRCHHCGSVEAQHISVFGKYAHIYWIPFFPMGKTAVSECTHCLKTIEQEEFPKQLQKLYEESKGQIKRPYWHWLGLGIIATLIGAFSLVGESAEDDSRSELLDADIEQMALNPTMESDSVSYTLKAFFNDFANEEIDPDEFKFLTRVKENKVLILAKIPNLKKVKKERRMQVIEMIELVANLEESFKDKEIYIGVRGKYTMMIVKTPTVTKNGSIVSAAPLFDFYGAQAISDN